MFKKITNRKVFNTPIPKTINDSAIVRAGDFNALIDDINELGELVNSLLVLPPISGPPGPQGPIGPMGPQGPAGPVGPAGLTWQGAWDGTNVSYVKDDAVAFGGASWFCIADIAADPANLDPSLDTTSWALLAAQGLPGPQGPQGTNGSVFYLKVSDGITVSGGGSNFQQITDTILIPANTLTKDSLLKLQFGIQKISGGTVQPRLFINTSNSLVGATQIAAGLNITTNSEVSTVTRNLHFNFTLQNFKILGPPTTIMSIAEGATRPMSIFSLDPTVDNYLLMASHHPSTGTISKLVYASLNID